MRTNEGRGVRSTSPLPPASKSLGSDGAQHDVASASAPYIAPVPHDPCWAGWAERDIPACACVELVRSEAA